MSAREGQRLCPSSHCWSDSVKSCGYSMNTHQDFQRSGWCPLVLLSRVFQPTLQKTSLCKNQGYSARLNSTSKVRRKAKLMLKLLPSSPSLSLLCKWHRKHSTLWEAVVAFTLSLATFALKGGGFYPSATPRRCKREEHMVLRK